MRWNGCKGEAMRRVILNLSLMLVCCKTEEKTAPAVPAKSTPPVRFEYKFSDLEKNVFRSLLIEDITTYAQGGDAFSASSNTIQLPRPVSAESLQIVYEGNEVLGDKMFRQKLLSVFGVVASIDRSVGENYSVSLQGGTNVFAKPRASMADGFTDYLAALKKGQKITLICTGEGMLLGSAILKECQPLDTWAEQVVTDYRQSFPDRIIKQDTAAAMLLLMTVAMSMRPERLTDCFKRNHAVNQKCLEKAAGRLDSATYDSAFGKIKVAGMDLKKFFPK